MMTAMCAARNILGANYDLWAINTEAEYHEEKQGKPATLAEVETRRPAFAEPPLIPAASMPVEPPDGAAQGGARTAKASTQGGLSTP